jgi:NitT/TauT family transport system substrate-binding protein
MTRKPYSRRRFLRDAGLATGLAAVPFIRAHGQSRLRPVTMRLDWLFNGPNVGFIIAKEKGFYEQAGLDVAIGPGKGSASTAQLVANKDSQFGFSDGFVLGNSVAKGMSIRMVASVFRRNPTGVVALAESNIKTPKDLEGKAVGIAPGATQFQQWPAFVKGCKLDASRIQVINVDPAGSTPALLTGKIQAVAGYVQGYQPAMNGIIVHNDLLKQDAALIRTFVAASLKGFLHGRQNPEEIGVINKKYSEASDPRITRREAEISWRTWVTPNTANRPLGWMSDKDWAATVEVLKQYGGVSSPLQASQLYTNDFVPTGKEFVPPQTA